MMSNPPIGARVVVRYARARAHLWPYHGRRGMVSIRGKGRPRNHAIRLDDGPVIVVPAGNIVPE